MLLDWKGRLDEVYGGFPEAQCKPVIGISANYDEGKSMLEDGVEVIERNDYNFSDVANAICSAVSRFSAMSDSDVEEVRRKASTLSQKALWKNFIVHYLNAYDKALGKAQSRLASE